MKSVFGGLVAIGLITFVVIAATVAIYANVLKNKAIDRMTALCESQKAGAPFDFERFSAQVASQRFEQTQPEKKMRPASDDEVVIRKMFPMGGGTSCHVAIKKALVDKASVVSIAN